MNSIPLVKVKIIRTKDFEKGLRKCNSWEEVKDFLESNWMLTLSATSEVRIKEQEDEQWKNQHHYSLPALNVTK